MNRLIFALLIIVFSFSSSPGAPVHHLPGSANYATASFTPDLTSFLNPEIGWYKDPPSPFVFNGTTDFSGFRGNNDNLTRAYIRLDTWVSSPLPGSLLTDLSAGFAQARSAGIKVIPRFTYNFTGVTPCTDATQAQILSHIAQLTTVLQANLDVIAFLEAGFVGCWGQWFGSLNLLNSNQSATQAIIAAEQAISPNLMIAIPTPDSTRFAEGQATGLKGFGVHNDCFQSTDNDDVNEFGRVAGAVVGGAQQIAIDRAYMQLLGTNNGLNGGEGTTACTYTATYSDCAAVLVGMQQYSFSYFIDSQAYVKWPSCEQTIQDTLGYRLQLQSVSYLPTVSHGGVFNLKLSVKNVNWSAPYNQRPVYAVLSDGVHTYSMQLSSVDWRTWLPGTSNVAAAVTVPGGAVPGVYSLYLWMPDFYASLQSNSAYSVRLANTGVWDGVTGYNTICSSCVTVQ